MANSLIGWGKALGGGPYERGLTTDPGSGWACGVDPGATRVTAKLDAAGMWGVTVAADQVAQVRSTLDFEELIASALEARSEQT